MLKQITIDIKHVLVQLMRHRGRHGGFKYTSTAYEPLLNPLQPPYVLQQQETTLGSIAFLQEQESEATLVRRITKPRQMNDCWRKTIIWSFSNLQLSSFCETPPNVASDKSSFWCLMWTEVHIWLHDLHCTVATSLADWIKSRQMHLGLIQMA